MLTIRRAQMEVFEAHMLRQFETQVLRNIARRCPVEFKEKGEEATRVLIRAGIQKAEQYGIEEKPDIERVAYLVFDRGPDFEKPEHMAWCREILEDKELPGDAKVALVYDELESQERAEDLEE